MWTIKRDCVTCCGRRFGVWTIWDPRLTTYYCNCIHFEVAMDIGWSYPSEEIIVDIKWQTVQTVCIVRFNLIEWSPVVLYIIYSCVYNVNNLLYWITYHIENYIRRLIKPPLCLREVDCYVCSEHGQGTWYWNDKFVRCVYVSLHVYLHVCACVYLFYMCMCAYMCDIIVHII